MNLTRLGYSIRGTLGLSVQVGRCSLTVAYIYRKHCVNTFYKTCTCRCTEAFNNLIVV